MDLLIVWISMVVFMTVTETKRHEVAVYPLNMMPDSVDDDYEGCSDKMSKLVKETYLPAEKKNVTFAKAWEKAENQTQENDLDNLTKDHAIAIRVYSYYIPNVHKCFNEAVRIGNKVYNSCIFVYHSLHFLLTDAIQRLNREHSCRKTYRGSNDKFKYSIMNKSIRFGYFTSTSLYPGNATRFGTISCFVVRTCYGALVAKYTQYPDNENEVLIPPYEVFKIEKVITDPKKQKDMKCKTVYQLKSTGMKSNLRCALFKKPCEVF
ncbi:NAD(P)(+)--arginine ADP-ribosyltransferase 2-like [Alosa pseudoharengus]|uniref:NAD(P)(+)--arginine ADP-ribosyltransferase 2-like n=1 Tax=Alosa pseudoharengus TaxID=34774 RepID=UPI003F8C9232